MGELNEIKKHLGCLEVCQNGFIKVSDVKNGYPESYRLFTEIK